MTDIRHFDPPEGPLRKLPFSEAVQIGDLIFLSGQLGFKPDALELVDGGIEAESRQTMENMKAALERVGSDLDHVLKCTVFLADIAEWPKFNEIYVSFFPGKKPARSALAASGLALAARVEVECIAVPR